MIKKRHGIHLIANWQMVSDDASFVNSRDEKEVVLKMYSLH